MASHSGKTLTLQLPWTLLVAIGDSNAKVFHPATAWYSIKDLLRVWPEFEQNASQPNFRAVAGLQVSNDPNFPGASTELGGPLTADGKNWSADTTVTSAIANVRFFRLGWLVWVNAGGTAPLFGRCGGEAVVTFDRG